jgi:hypothetical protein
MLLPDNIHPENTIYYNGAMILQELQQQDNRELIELFGKVKQERKMSFTVFAYCLDWLYLINAAKLDSQGRIHLCLSTN